MTARPVLGAGLKMYLSHEDTVSWLHSVAERLGPHPSLSSGEVELFVLPSFTALESAQRELSSTSISWGAQDVHYEDAGAFTGEVSAVDLVQLGCRYVEVGHKERITLCGETPDVIAAKTAQALRHGLTPIICVGEELPGPAEHAATVCWKQLEAYTQLAADSTSGLDVIIAYEPQWAIGASKPAPAQYVRDVVAGLRELNVSYPHASYLYGGTAGPGVLRDVFPVCDGLFLGRSSHSVVTLLGMLDEARALTS